MSLPFNKHRLLPVLLLLLYTGFILLPLLMAFEALSGTRPWRDDFASALAISGFSMLILEFTLSGRFKTLSAPVGMDIIMRIHQLIGRLLLVFLFLHPFFYTLDYQALPWDRSHAHSLSLDVISGSSALLAWLLLGVLVAMAIMRHTLAWRYESWRLSHLVLSIFIIVLAMIHVFQSGRYTALTDLSAFWLAGLALVLLTLLHVYVIIPLLQQRRPYRVQRVEAVAPRVWKLVLATDKKPLAFRAGQFAWLKFSGPFFSLQEHPFSISSHPGQAELEFTIKEYGDFTSRLAQLPAGKLVYLDGPHGNFTLHGRDGQGIMLVAGGVGIAPIMSLLRDLAARGEQRPVILLSCHHDEQQLIYAKEIEQLKTALNLQVIHLLSHPSASWQGQCGYISEAVLMKLLPDDYRQWLFFVCGPPGMMDCTESALFNLDVPLHQVVTERFSYQASSASPRNRQLLKLVTFLISLQLLMMFLLLK